MAVNRKEELHKKTSRTKTKRSIQIGPSDSSKPKPIEFPTRRKIPRSTAAAPSLRMNAGQRSVSQETRGRRLVDETGYEEDDTGGVRR